MKTRTENADLIKELKDPEFASEYIAQALVSGDRAVFLLAIRYVVGSLVRELIALETELRSNLRDIKSIRLADKIHCVRRAMQKHAGLVLTHKEVET
jgi:hypothetical protein